MQQSLCCSGGNGLYHVICEGEGGGGVFRVVWTAHSHLQLSTAVLSVTKSVNPDAALSLF